MRLLFQLHVAALLLTAISAMARVELGRTFTGKVMESTDEVTDGDTYDIHRSIAGEVTVRLFGVDAPESSQPYGGAATRAARQLIGGESVPVSVEDVGQYGRAAGLIGIRGGPASSRDIAVRRRAQ